MSQLLSISCLPFEMPSISCGGTDPLIHRGRHFGRTVHALCSVSALLVNGILCIGELAEQEEGTFTHEYVRFFTPWVQL